MKKINVIKNVKKINNLNLIKGGTAVSEQDPVTIIALEDDLP